MIFNIFMTILSIVTGFVSLWLMVTFLARFVLKRKPSFKHSEPKTRFAILIAARNEETVIQDIICSLQNQNYPSELFDIYTVINNTTDTTQKLACQAGSNTIVCPSSIKNKGQALKYTFSLFEQQHNYYDAFCIFDADNLVDPMFLSYMNDGYQAGFRVAQGYRETKNRYSSWISSDMSLFFDMVNEFANESRWRLNMSASLNGTGLMISRETVNSIGYDPVTLTEDMEYTCVCSIHDVKVAWIPEAIFYDEQTDSFIDSISQRKRWNAGQIQCLIKYGKAMLKRRSLQSFDFLIYLLGIIMLCAPIFIVPLTLLQIDLMWNCSWNELISLFGIGLVITCIAEMFSGMVILLIKNKKLEGKDFITLLTLPLFIFSWRIICLLAIIDPPKRHEYIQHKGTM